MSIRLYKSYTPGTRNRAISAFTEITKTKPEKKLINKNIEYWILPTDSFNQIEKNKLSKEL